MKTWVGNIAVLLGLVAWVTMSHADGFDCESKQADLKIEVRNFRNAAEGTRNVDYLSLENMSDAKTNVAFESSKGTLRNRATYYIVSVDLRYSNIRTSKLKLFGQRLSSFESLYLNVDFSYSKPVSGGAKVKAEFSALDRKTRDLKKLTLTCERVVD